MGEERKDSILWGTEFQRWKYTYMTLEAALNAMRTSSGPVSSTFLGSTQGAERHPFLLEVKLRVMEMYYMKAAEDPRREMVQRKREEFETVKEAELNGIRNISNRIYEIMEEMEKMLDSPNVAEKDEVGDVWDEVFEEEGVAGNFELKNLEERLHEECAELGRFLTSKSGDVRLAAAEALAHAKYTSGLVDYAYAEIFPENRRKIIDEVLVAVRLGAIVGDRERSMLLKMTEDVDPGCAEKAWAIVFRLFNRNLLSQEQLEYLLAKETVPDGEEKADLSRKAHFWMRMACSNEVDAKERASLFSRIEEAIWMGARLGEAEMKLFAPAIGNAQGEAARRAWSLVMELLEKNQLDKEQISGLVLHADTIEDKNERKRILDRMEGRLREIGRLGNEADRALDAQRLSNFLLDAVRPERPSGVPMRRSQPPAADGKRDSAPPEGKVPAKC